LEFFGNIGSVRRASAAFCGTTIIDDLKSFS